MIRKLETNIVKANKQIVQINEELKQQVRNRFEDLEKFVKKFEDLHQENEPKFGVEMKFDPVELNTVSMLFNKVKKSDYITIHDNSDKRHLRIQKIRNNPGKFLEAIYSGEQSVLKDVEKVNSATKALSFTEELRFKATLEGDSIGGFSESSMTEGKQALFALTLLLDRVSDTWPLLIDQPEDDLDSRSIYDAIVPFLKNQKRRRQIIMVSHNANLVIGADSEQVIVANRHGNDRKNDDNQLFDYLTGSLESTKPRNDGAGTVLSSSGIREHACDILDGGEQAFESRKNKYNI